MSQEVHPGDVPDGEAEEAMDDAAGGLEGTGPGPSQDGVPALSPTQAAAASASAAHAATKAPSHEAGAQNRARKSQNRARKSVAAARQKLPPLVSQGACKRIFRELMDEPFVDGKHLKLGQDAAMCLQAGIWVCTHIAAGQASRPRRGGTRGS